MDVIGKWQMEARARTERKKNGAQAPRQLADARLSETRPTVFLREMEGVSKGCSTETSFHSWSQSSLWVSTDGAEPCAGSPRSVPTDRRSLGQRLGLEEIRTMLRGPAGDLGASRRLLRLRLLVFLFLLP